MMMLICIKVARVVKFKLAFMEWFFYNLLILIKVCKIRYLNVDKFGETGLFVWKIENFDELQLPESLIFLLKFCTRFLLNNVYKRVFGVFLFCLDLELLISVKNECAETTYFFIFANNPRSKKKLKKNSRTPFCRHW